MMSMANEFLGKQNAGVNTIIFNAVVVAKAIYIYNRKIVLEEHIIKVYAMELTFKFFTENHIFKTNIIIGS